MISLFSRYLVLLSTCFVIGCAAKPTGDLLLENSKIGCSLPAETAKVEFASLTGKYPVYKFGEISVLGMTSVTLGGEGGKAELRQFPLLPSGGIAQEDFCEIVFVGGTSSVLVRGASFVSGLRLKRGLNLSAKYPEASVQIDANRQLFTLPGGFYVSLAKGPDNSAASKTISKLEEEGSLDLGTPNLTIGDRVFVRLAS